MKKTLKRISVLILALAMVFAMGITAFAADTDDTPNNWKGIETTDNTIGIAKQIVFVNGEDTTVREPNITYTYTISAAAPGTTTTITDHNDISGTVKAGPIGAVSATTATVSFADTATAAANANGTGEEDIKYANFTFTPATFGAPGIYRYKIAETSNVTKASVGVTEAATYNANRYLDVYVSKTSSTDPTLKIYGYVLFEGTDTTSITDDDVSMKSAGYVNKSTTTGSQEDVDVYTTQNLYIDKTTTGVMADPANDFPVNLALTAASGVTATPKIDVTLGGNAALTGTATDTVGTYITFATAMTGTVDNGSSIYLKGIPAGGTAALTETNNTPDSYKVKAGKTSGAADLLAEAIVAAGANSAATNSQTLNARVNVYLTNTLDAISPTGVVVRYAPYALILAAGIVLFGISRRRKANEED